MHDLISRKEAIDAVSRGCQEFRGIFAECEKNLNELQSTQPDLPIKEKCTFCPHCNNCDVNDDLSIQPCVDTISRQAAIDLIERMKPYQLDGEDCQEIIHNMPPAQPVNYGSTNLIDKNEVLDAIHKVIFSIIDTKSPLTVIDKQLLSINKAITTKIKDLPSAQPDGVDLFPDVSEEYKKGYRDGLRDKPEPHWIPCSERFPEKSGRYLVTRGLNACGSLWNRIYIANYSDLMGIKSEKIWWQGNVGKSDFERLDDVIAWMPLQEPYREDGSCHEPST